MPSDHAKRVFWSLNLEDVFCRAKVIETFCQNSYIPQKHDTCNIDEKHPETAATNPSNDAAVLVTRRREAAEAAQKAASEAAAAAARGPGWMEVRLGGIRLGWLN